MGLTCRKEDQQERKQYCLPFLQTDNSIFCLGRVSEDTDCVVDDHDVLFILGDNPLVEVQRTLKRCIIKVIHKIYYYLFKNYYTIKAIIEKEWAFRNERIDHKPHYDTQIFYTHHSL